MLTNMLSYFTDPVLQAPTIACMLMCLSAALIGVIVFIQKSSLIGETLSHATYPGVILAACVLQSFHLISGKILPIFVLSFAAISAYIALKLIHYLQKRFAISQDASLCTVLAIFFGVGITLASYAQSNFSKLFVQVQTFLYGQAATMTNEYITIYAILAFIIILVIVVAHKEILVVNFDRTLANTLGIANKWIDNVISLLLVCAIVIGIRGVGLILMSGMLIAPAIVARYFSNSLKRMFLVAGLVGLFSGFMGVFLSVEIGHLATAVDSVKTLSLPTGPMIILVAGSACLFAIIFAPKKGVLVRCIRNYRFKNKCLVENILKSIWRINCHKEAHISDIAKYIPQPKWRLLISISFLVRQGWLNKTDLHSYTLTHEGRSKAEHIIRLHRLWEVYLVDYLGFGEEKVHKNAEEVEHFITPDLEAKLIELMDNPKQDPHNQPIPEPKGLV